MLATSVPALAAGTCKNNGVIYFDGAQLSSSKYSGSRLNAVEADIVVRQQNLCSGANQDVDSFAWDMLGSSGTNQYAQSGYIELGNNSIQDFYSEYRNGSGDNFHRKTFPSGVIVGPITRGTKYFFRTIRFLGDGKIRLEACVADTTNCDVWDTTPFDPYGDWTTPLLAFAYGETHDLQSDMPGTSANHAGFSNIQVEINSTWRTFDWSECDEHSGGAACAGNPTRYHNNFATASPKDHFPIWTDPL